MLDSNHQPPAGQVLPGERCARGISRARTSGGSNSKSTTVTSLCERKYTAQLLSSRLAGPPLASGADARSPHAWRRHIGRPNWQLSVALMHRPAYAKTRRRHTLASRCRLAPGAQLQLAN